MNNEIKNFRQAIDEGQPYSNHKLVQVKSAADMLVTLELYVSEFENSFIQNTHSFYT